MNNRFDKLAAQWDSKPMRVEIAMSFINHIKSTIDCDISKFSMLDYGCGSGLISFGFAACIDSITGMDYSSGMVNKYNNKAKELGFEHLLAQKHNINDEILELNKYNLIATNMTMHHIQDIENFIKVLKDSLSNDGYLYISDLVKEDGKFHSMGNNDVEHLGFDNETIYKVFENYGFKDIQYSIIQTVKKDHGDYPIFSISGKI